eukprot:gene4851-7130_t
MEARRGAAAAPPAVLRHPAPRHAAPRGALAIPLPHPPRLPRAERVVRAHPATPPPRRLRTGKGREGRVVLSAVCIDSAYPVTRADYPAGS